MVLKKKRGMSKLEERFEKIRQAVKHNNEGAVNHKIVEDIKVSYKMFNYDYKELLNLAEGFNASSSAETLDMNNDDSLSELSKNTLKLLNNYVLASKSLRDHTKVFVNSHYKDSEFYKEHDMKIKEIFGESQLLHFVQELRNYTFNRDLPLIVMGVENNENREVRKVLGLDIEKLHQWSGWTNGTKALINNLEGNVELSWFIEKYWMEVEGFYQWFNSKLNSVSQMSNLNVMN